MRYHLNTVKTFPNFEKNEAMFPFLNTFRDFKLTCAVISVYNQSFFLISYAHQVCIYLIKNTVKEQ